MLYRETATLIEIFCGICKCCAWTKCKLSCVDLGCAYANQWALKYCGIVSEFAWKVNRRNVWTAGVSAAAIVASRMRWEVDQDGVAVVADIFLGPSLRKRGGVGGSRNIVRYRVNTISRVLSLHQPTGSIHSVSGRINTTEIITSILIHIFSFVCILCSLGLVIVMLLTNYIILNTADV